MHNQHNSSMNTAKSKKGLDLLVKYIYFGGGGGIGGVGWELQPQ